MASVTARAPWHFWLVVLIAVLWNGFGAYDYVSSMTQGAAYFRAMGMTEAQIDYLALMPVWMKACWAVGVWASVTGTVLLIVRSRWAVHAFAVSLAGILAMIVHTHLLSDGTEIMGQQGAIMNVVITGGCLFFLWYAWRMGKRGLLR